MADHRPVDYWSHPEGPDPDTTVERFPEPDPHLRVTSTCAACQGRSVRVFRPVVPIGTKGVLPWDRPDEPVPPTGPRTFVCACGYPHGNRPAGATDTGCGAYWTVDL